MIEVVVKNSLDATPSFLVTGVYGKAIIERILAARGTGRGGIGAFAVLWNLFVVFGAFMVEIGLKVLGGIAVGRKLITLPHNFE